jgi:cation diffusion facilitator CzcD-associated flavoprotein CzcO
MMEYSDSFFSEELQLFPKSESVLEYLNDYAKDIKHLIRFETQVREVKLNDAEKGDWAVNRVDVRTGENITDIYDAVVVANGHYDVPYLPAIPGIEAWNQIYPEVISHSKLYDSPDDFRGKKVLLVGNSASALDIGSQISKVCKEPLLMSQRSISYLSPEPRSDRRAYGEIKEFLLPRQYNRAVRFVDGTIVDELDAILFCTGYLYSYPFLSSLDPPVFTSGAAVLNVFQQLFYIDQPTMAFAGLPQRVIPFPLSENQASVFSRVWSGRLELPSQEEMRIHENSVIAAKGDGKKYHLLSFPLDADYLNYLYDWAETARLREGLENNGRGKIGVRWGEKERWLRQNFPLIKMAFNHEGDKRHSVHTLEELGFDFRVCNEKRSL